MAVHRPVLCDLDGTVVDTAPLIFEGLHIACADVGVTIPRDRDLHFCLGPPLHWCLEELGVPKDVLPDATVAFERYHTDHLDRIQPMPGVQDVFAELHAERVPIGIVTIKPEGIADLVLTEVGLHGFITQLVARSNDLDTRTKFDLLREAMDHPDLQGPNPIYMGDHDTDEQAARDLDVPFLRYPQTPWTEIRAAIYGVTADVP